MMPNKPLPPNSLKSKRLLERRAVTIIAGFRCYDGVVICADTQETVNNLSKRNVPKLRFEPVDWLERTEAVTRDGLAIAFCGASETGPFIDKIVERAWEDAQTGTSLDEVCSLIETSIKETYKEFGRIYQPGY